MATPYPFDSEQSLVLECSICVESYAEDYDHVPRTLHCGHTFSTSCFMKMISGKGVKCPICSKWHPLPEPDVARIPINFAVLDIVRGSVPIQNPEEVKGPLCEACNLKPASSICLDCSPGTLFRFCSECDKNEHERGFAPSARHRRRPEGNITSSIHVFCTEHPKNEATYFSVELNQFGCQECTQNPMWSTRSKDFEPIGVAVRKLRGNAQRMIQCSKEIVDRLSASKRELIDAINGLGGSSVDAKSNVSKTFGEIIEIIQKRQMYLLKYVDEISENRKEILESQQSKVAEASSTMFGAHSELNQFITKPDFEFLVNYRAVALKMEQLLENEDKSLYRPVIGKQIPFCIPKDLPKELQSVGAIGGGETPIEVSCNPTTLKGSIMHIQWQLSNETEKVQKFQLEYELLPEFHTLAGNTKFSGPRDTVFQQFEIQYQEVPGNKLATYVDKLCPGFTYRFRIRSANAAGWGMWSNSALGKCDDFPLNVTCTKQIHCVRIPYTGLYRITANGSKATDGQKCCGGRGAIIMATFSLSAGDLLIILCGGMSTLQDFSTGGGGGTFVIVNEITEENLLIAAGGGGGTRGYDEQDLDGCDASLEPDGTSGRGFEHGEGGTKGGPGQDANSSEFIGPCWGFGGAGYMQSSKTAKCVAEGGGGGQSGGFGGGGGVGTWGGGGGGGYSGGGGGRGGGGGGSFVRADGMDVVKQVENEDHGCVTVEQVSMSPFGTAAVPSQFGASAAVLTTQTSPEPSLQPLIPITTSASSQALLPITVPGSQPPVQSQFSSASSASASSASTSSHPNVQSQFSTASSSSYRTDSGSSGFIHSDSYNNMSITGAIVDVEEPFAGIANLTNTSPKNSMLQPVAEEPVPGSQFGLQRNPHHIQQSLMQQQLVVKEQQSVIAAPVLQLGPSNSDYMQALMVKEDQPAAALPGLPLGLHGNGNPHHMQNLMQQPPPP